MVRGGQIVDFVFMVVFFSWLTALDTNLLMGTIGVTIFALFGLWSYLDGHQMSVKIRERHRP